tara:strand:- start:610 stop:846 length:237 start_codon:yes stop_codon:yes gene_type:complete
MEGQSPPHADVGAALMRLSAEHGDSPENLLALRNCAAAKDGEGAATVKTADAALALLLYRQTSEQQFFDLALQLIQAL